MYSLRNRVLEQYVRTFRPLYHWFEDRAFLSLIQHVGMLLGGGMAAVVMDAIALGLTARTLRPEQFGTLILIHTYAFVVGTLISFQSWQAITKYGADAMVEGRQEDLKSLIKFGILLDAITAILGTVIALCGLVWMSQWQNWNALAEQMAAVYCFTIAFDLAKTPTAVLQLFGRFKWLAVERAAVAGVKLICIAIAFMNGAGLWSFLFIWMSMPILHSLALLGMSWVELRRQGLRQTMSASVRGISRMYPGIWKFVLFTNFSSSIRLGAQEIDVLIVGGLLGSVPTAVYKVVKLVGSIPVYLAEPIRESLYPQMAKQWAMGSTKEFVSWILRVGCLSGLAGVAIWSFFAVGGRWILDLVVGQELGSSAYAPSLVYMMAYVVYLFGIALRPAMLSMEHPERILLIYTGIHLIYFPVLVLLLQSIGVIGAAVAQLFFYISWFVAMSLSILLFLRTSTKRSSRRFSDMWDQFKIAIRDHVIGQENATCLTLMQNSLSVHAKRSLRRVRDHHLERNEDPPLRISKYSAEWGQTFFGYYDITPFSKKNDRILAMVVPQMNRTPQKNEYISLGYFDRYGPSKFVEVAKTTTWSWQQGARLQWYPENEDELILYNKIVDGRYGSIIHNIHTQEIVGKYPRATYALDSSGKWSLSLNFSRLQRLRPGYGYVNLPDMTEESRCPEEDGIWLTNLLTGESELIVSLGFLARLNPLPSMVNAEHYINHISFCPSGEAFMFFHLWIQNACLFNRLIVCDRTGTNHQVLVDEGKVSHYAWKSDRELLVTVNLDHGPSQYNLYCNRSRQPVTIGQGLLVKDGHPTYSPDRQWLLTDTYPDRFGDHHLLLYSVEEGLMEIGRFFLPPHWRGETRCDLHPRWDRTGRSVCIDSAHGGVRAIYVIDLELPIGTSDIK